MPQELETPPDFPGMEDVSEGDVKKFLVEVKCTGKEDDGAMEWEVISIDGVKPETDEEEAGEPDEDGVSDEYDTSQDENNPDEGTSAEEDFTPSGKPKTTKGIGMLIVSGKPK